LEQLFDRLDKYGLVIKSEKCVFAVATVDFLVHAVSVKGIKPMSSHTAALLQHPLPSNIKQLQAFLGLVNFYRRFIPVAANTVARLFQTFPAKVAGKFEKIRPLQKILCKATFQTPFVQRK
jgi:putative transposase